MIENFREYFQQAALIGRLIFDVPYTSLEVEEGRDWIGMEVEHSFRDSSLIRMTNEMNQY